MQTKRREDNMPNGERALNQSGLVAFPGARQQPYEQENSKEVSRKRNVVSWIWWCIRIYLNDVHIMPMTDRPQPKGFNWSLMVSIATLALAMTYGFWSWSDRHATDLKRSKDEGIQLGVQQQKDSQTQHLLLKQSKEIDDLKKTLGLLPPDKKEKK